MQAITETEFAPDAEYILQDPEPLQRGTVYLLHFERPISEKHTTQHYIGWAKHLPSRIAKHMKGDGARLTQVAVERNIGFVIARTWNGDRTMERKLKDRKEGPRLCPICKQAHSAQDFASIDDLI
jgi:predicted GIY-YIG superfamily endonuclease